MAVRTEYNLRLRSTPRHPELEDSTLRYLQDLLAWVEENQRRLDSAEWGVDLPSVEAQLGSHRGLHQSVEEFRTKIERARTDEVSGGRAVGAGQVLAAAGLTSPHLPQGQLSPATRGAYRDCLGRLDLQYTRLLVSGGRLGAAVGGWEGAGGWEGGAGLTHSPPACSQSSSKARLRSLESLHGFVAAATKELMWLSDREEEEVGFDWSDRNTNMAAKKEGYSVRQVASLRALPSHDCPPQCGSGSRPRVVLGGRWVDPDAALAPPLRALASMSGPDARTRAEGKENQRDPGHRRPPASGRPPCPAHGGGGVGMRGPPPGPPGVVGQGWGDPPGPLCGAGPDGATCCAAVLPGGPADPVELDATAVLLYRGAPKGQHRLLPGENWAPQPRLCCSDLEEPLPVSVRTWIIDPAHCPMDLASESSPVVGPSPSGPCWGSFGRGLSAVGLALPISATAVLLGRAGG